MPKPIEDDQVLQDILAALIRTEDNNQARHVELVKKLSGIADQGSASSPATKTDLKRIEDKIDQIMATEQQVIDALAKIDAATTKVGTNVQAVATTVGTVSTGLQTVSDEMDAILAALQNSGVSQTILDQASALGDKVQAASDGLQAASDALTAQVPVLQAIAAKGVLNPVPVPPPAPPTA